MKGRRNVLVVEDHPELRRVLSECLERLGFSTLEASDGRAALNHLAEGTPDLVCLDVVLPESSGYDLCQHIRRTPRLQQVPVLMMTGRRMPAEEAFAAEVGADAFLAKPFSEAELQARVEGLLSVSAAADHQGEVDL
jgi:DNA-binding response OmpR family regulator